MIPGAQPRLGTRPSGDMYSLRRRPTLPSRPPGSISLQLLFGHRPASAFIPLYLRPLARDDARDLFFRSRSWVLRSRLGAPLPIMGVQLGGSLAGKLSTELASTSSKVFSTIRLSREGFFGVKSFAVIVHTRDYIRSHRHLAEDDLRWTHTRTAFKLSLS